MFATLQHPEIGALTAHGKKPMKALEVSRRVLDAQHSRIAGQGCHQIGPQAVVDGLGDCVYYLKGDSDTAWIRAVRFREEDIVRPLTR